MIPKIMNEQAESVAPLLAYNERKVAAGTAEVVAAVNMEAPGPEGIRSTFEHYQWRALGSRKLGFHMCFNPSPGEEMRNPRLVEYIARMMEGLGYGAQPYVIYRHRDTDREHYHVVSVRTDRNGKKIPDYREFRRCNELARSLAEEFGYSVAKGRGKPEEPAGDEPERNRFGVVQFDALRGDVLEQMKALAEHALGYRFTSFEQFVMIMRVHGIKVTERTGRQTRLVLQGLDERGRPCTRQVTEKALGVPLYELYSRRALDSVSYMRVMRRERGRVASCCRGPLLKAVSERNFLYMVRACRIDVALHRAGAGDCVKGADFVDHVTGCAFRLGDFGEDLSLEMIREADENRWCHGQDNDAPAVTLGDILAGLSGGSSRSREKDAREDPKKKKKGRKMNV